MKKTKKILAAVLAVSTLAATLSGCSGGNKTNESVEFTEAASTAAGTSESTEAKPYFGHRLLTRLCLFLGAERTLIVLQMARELCFVLIQRETLKANNLICFMEHHPLKV